MHNYDCTQRYVKPGRANDSFGTCSHRTHTHTRPMQNRANNNKNWQNCWFYPPRIHTDTHMWNLKATLRGLCSSTLAVHYRLLHPFPHSFCTLLHTQKAFRHLNCFEFCCARFGVIFSRCGASDESEFEPAVSALLG